VPGTWVLAPQWAICGHPDIGVGTMASMFGMLAIGAPHIGFYGGINYGFGYVGEGFEGGEWRGGSFFYNRSVTNVNITNVTNIYNKTVIVNNNTHVAFNGGQGGTAARPTARQEAFAHESHRGPVAAQLQHQRAASQTRALSARGEPRPATGGRHGPTRRLQRTRRSSRQGCGEAPTMLRRYRRSQRAHRPRSEIGQRRIVQPEIVPRTIERRTIPFKIDPHRERFEGGSSSSSVAQQ